MKPLTSKTTAPAFDSYLLDTCKIVATGEYRPGAITYRGRKKIEVVQWKDKAFPTQHEADMFVQQHFVKKGIEAPTEEAVLFRPMVRPY